MCMLSEDIRRSAPMQAGAIDRQEQLLHTHQRRGRQRNLQAFSRQRLFISALSMVLLAIGPQLRIQPMRMNSKTKGAELKNEKT